MQRIIEEIKGCLEHQYYFAALILALAIPDVCLSFEKSKDKKLKCYTQWCHRWFDTDFDVDVAVVYALRCSMMHSLNNNVEEQPAYKQYKKEKVLIDSRKEEFRFFIPGSDLQNRIQYFQENSQSVKHELCISRLIYQIIDAYEKFQAAYPDFSYTCGENWI